MRVQITARHCEVPDAVRERAHQLMEKLTKYEPRLLSAEVVFDEERHNRKVEVILSVGGGAPVVAQADDREFRAALDKAADRAGRVLRKRRDRVVDHQAERPEDVTTD